MSDDTKTETSTAQAATDAPLKPTLRYSELRRMLNAEPQQGALVKKLVDAGFFMPSPEFVEQKKDLAAHLIILG